MKIFRCRSFFLVLVTFVIIVGNLAQDADEFEDLAPRPIKLATPPSIENLPDDVTTKLDTESSNDLPKRKGWMRFSSKTIYGNGNFVVEIFFIFLAFLWSILYLWGLGRNTIIADHWVAHNLDFLQGQFAYVGPAATPKELNDGPKHTHFYFIESATQFRLFMSGRKGLQGVTAFMEMRPRQDILMSILELVFPRMDTITFTAVMGEDAAGVDPALLVLCRKGKIGAIHTAHPALKELTSLITATDINLPASLQLFAENSDCAKDILAPLIAHIRARPYLFEELVLTDQHTDPVAGFAGNPKRIARIKLRLPAKQDLKELTALVEGTFALIDHVTRLHLSAAAKARVAKARASIVEREEKRLLAQRQNEAAKQKAERLQKEKEQEKERYEALSAEAKARHDEAEEKRKKKEQMAKFRPKIK